MERHCRPMASWDAVRSFTHPCLESCPEWGNVRQCSSWLFFWWGNVVQFTSNGPQPQRPRLLGPVCGTWLLLRLLLLSGATFASLQKFTNMLCQKDSKMRFLCVHVFVCFIVLPMPPSPQSFYYVKPTAGRFLLKFFPPSQVLQHFNTADRRSQANQQTLGNGPITLNILGNGCLNSGKPSGKHK